MSDAKKPEPIIWICSWSKCRKITQAKSKNGYCQGCYEGTQIPFIQAAAYQALEENLSIKEIAIAGLDMDLDRYKSLFKQTQEKLRVAVEVVEKAVNMDRSRGYPTGTEWMALVDRFRSALQKIEGNGLQIDVQINTTNESCPKCKSTEFMVARDMKSTRHCIRCHQTWLPEKIEAINRP